MERVQLIYLGTALRHRLGPLRPNALHQMFPRRIVCQAAASDLSTQRLKKGVNPMWPGGGSRGVVKRRRDRVQAQRNQYVPKSCTLPRALEHKKT